MFIANQDTTIANITHSIALSFDALISPASDRMAPRPSEMTMLDDVNYGLRATNTERMNTSQVGANTFNVRTQVTAAPEPETYGMILVGLGLLGYSVRRRKKPPYLPT